VFVPFSRVLTILMAGVVCFGLIIPIALQRRNAALAVAVGAAYAIYLVVNVLLWRRMRPRA
jgi:uncharacterized protein (DUF58 family)